MKQLGLMQALMQTRRADRMTDEQRFALQQRRLRELVAYVRENSPYFARLYDGVGESFSLEELPPTDKRQLMTNFDTWFTDRAVTREKVDRFMSDLSNVGKLLEGKYLVYTTSGSTGDPCIVLYDKTAVNVSAAIGATRSFARPGDMRAFMKQGGRTLALFADNGFYLGTGSVRYNLRKMPWKKKKMKTFDVRRPTEEIVEMLNAYQPSMIGCYPTAMELLAREQEKGNLRIHPVIIMTGGEQLNADVRQHLTETFGCYVQTNYSCTEGGTVACECVNRHFHINDDWVILEAVDEHKRPVPFGTQSARILLTNLANKICPIIRFEITDRVVMHGEACGCGNPRPWLTLEGRTDDILTFAGGVRIAPMALYALMKEVEGVNRFQLILKKEGTLEMRLDATDRQRAFANAKAALDRFLASQGTEARVVLAEELPSADPVSGKYRHIIRE